MDAESLEKRAKEIKEQALDDASLMEMRNSIVALADIVLETIKEIHRLEQIPKTILPTAPPIEWTNKSFSQS